MDTLQIMAETDRLTNMVKPLGWSWAEVSYTAGPYPWRFTFGGFDRKPFLIQGESLDAAIANARKWIADGTPHKATA